MAVQYDEEQRQGIERIMTDKQRERFNELKEGRQSAADPRGCRPCRRLLEAPAGSGKSFIAVRLAASELHEQEKIAAKYGKPQRESKVPMREEDAELVHVVLPEVDSVEWLDLR